MSSSEISVTDINAWLPLDTIAEGLYARGYCVLPNLLPSPIVMALIHAFDKKEAELRPAEVGRGDDQQSNVFVRRDRITWLDPQDPVLAEWFDAMQVLRLALNERLFLGLFDFECQLAHYAPGGFYRRHLDAFRGRSNRRVSLVAYLNRGWLPDQGGELAMYAAEHERESFVKVTPALGTVVLFLSEEIPHEVLMASRDRYSVAGWFRVNDTLDNRLDPPL